MNIAKLAQDETSWQTIMDTLQKVSYETDYELIIGWSYSYWNKEGENPLGRDFDGYEDELNIVEAINAMIDYWNEIFK
jgi:hypothetical protein